ncbi:type I-F CRISPR-associated helicase Cas3f [Zobellella aerophila]|uniref:Type I-F CRISPR-associated helicase Cas3f n=1 Tax=Zobellella aerophila TaxID=870480 RepID=A0ABP6VGU9_9GAMM
MNILLVSQCNKRALQDTRRILDQFAERKGDRTWQTVITQEGLLTLRKLLRKTARRNTAVACHWLKTGGRSELLWIVGNMSKFNEQGTVPTNTTGLDVLKTKDEDNWHTAEVIALLAGIAGLFHDFGKANRLFQEKLLVMAMRAEPYRHEWVSLRLFQAFVNGRSDQEWLTHLEQVSPNDDAAILACLRDIQDGAGQLGSNPFKALPPLARTIGWLIVSHHRLPQFVKCGSLASPDLESLAIDSERLNASWNSPQCLKPDWTDDDWQQVWQFDQGTPVASQTWCNKAHQLAERALKHTAFLKRNWLAEDPFTLHLARLSLMLADHSYSAGAAVAKWQDDDYQAYANTDRVTRALKQQLDEHNIGVGHNALLLARRLPKLRRYLPAISRHKKLKKRSTLAEYRWQDKAYELAQGLASASSRQGFFGVNMASTGCGKTFANARIMYGLSDEKQGCRFSVALGLRTLTLQTGDALRERLHLESDELAVLIGSQAVKQLHELRVEDVDNISREEKSGSESAAPLVDEDQHVRYDGSLDDGPLRRWLEQSDKLHQLISAPVLVSTIDHLIPATEGGRGGKQIAPMLRLLTSDLVLDEPDDFDLADLPALCRLVNWAGLLGSRVLLSSATLPPALICALFDAYLAGCRIFNVACGLPETPDSVCCAWFDEQAAEHGQHANLDSFKEQHQAFVTRRVARLTNRQHALRMAELLPVAAVGQSAEVVMQAVASTLYKGIWRLHQAHSTRQQASGKTASIGLIRMANIKDLVAVSQQLCQLAPPADFRLHFCVYHSQHPMLVRSKMEARLDAALDRHHSDALWEVPEIKAALNKHPERHHVFVVCSSPVAEVGRDHDYDWAIAEPSSMRSLIQLAGRIQRHRKQPPEQPNLLIFNKNIKALRGKSPAYLHPGFEHEREPEFQLKQHDLGAILEPEQYRWINANPRILRPVPLRHQNNLVGLEHAHLSAQLFGHKKIANYAAQWWRHQSAWCFELQRLLPFRQSRPDERFFLWLQEEGDHWRFCSLADDGNPELREKSFKRVSYQCAPAVSPWLDNDPEALIGELAERLDQDVERVSLRFTELRLRVGNENTIIKWHYHPWFGVYDMPD